MSDIPFIQRMRAGKSQGTARYTHAMDNCNEHCTDKERKYIKGKIEEEENKVDELIDTEICTSRRAMTLDDL